MAMIRLMTRALGNLSTSPFAKTNPLCYSLLKYRFFSQGSSSIVQSATDVVQETEPDATDVIEETEPDANDVGWGKEDPVYPQASVSPATPTFTLLQPRVVVYDGVCHLCHGWVKWVIEADKHRKIKFCCLQSKAAEPYLKLCGLEKEDVMRRFLFVEGLGLYHQGSTAALRVVSYLPLPYSVLSTLFIVPTPVRDAVYDYVAQRRYKWFGKANHCLVLNHKELLERFIDRDEIIESK